MRESLASSTLAHYFAELLDRFTGESEADHRLYELLSQALSWLCDPHDAGLVARFYELQLLGLAGFGPELHHCPICGKALEPAPSFFSAALGGVLCSECGQSRRDAFPLSLAAFKVLRYGQTHVWSEFRRLRLSPKLQSETETAMHRFLLYVLERNLKSADFLRQLRREAMLE